MILFAQAEPELSIGQLLIVGGVLGGFAVVWINVAARLWQRQPVLPRQARRPVPWKGIDLLAVLILWISLEAIAGSLVFHSLGHLADAAPEAEATNQHPIALLMAEGNFFLLLVSGLSAVAVAPIFEEFVFRVLFQGWLESSFGRLRWIVPQIGRFSVVMPVVISSLLFSLIHYREAAPPSSVWLLAYLFLASSVVRLTIMVAAVAFLRIARGATAADFGWSAPRCISDVGLGVAAFGGLALPMYATSFVLRSSLPDSPFNDPLALLPLAVVLGVIYYRTHRIMPVIALHMSLNFTSLAAAWLSVQ